MLGDVKTAHFECKNSGNGSGIFAIIPESGLILLTLKFLLLFLIFLQSSKLDTITLKILQKHLENWKDYKFLLLKLFQDNLSLLQGLVSEVYQYLYYISNIFRPIPEISVEVAFSPLGDPAQYSIKYRIVGDNGFSDPFTLEGLSCSPIFEITSISGNDLSVFAQEDNFPSTDFVLHDLLFDSLNPATQQTKKGNAIQ